MATAPDWKEATEEESAPRRSSDDGTGGSGGGGGDHSEETPTIDTSSLPGETSYNESSDRGQNPLYTGRRNVQPVSQRTRSSCSECKEIRNGVQPKERARNHRVRNQNRLANIPLVHSHLHGFFSQRISTFAL